MNANCFAGIQHALLLLIITSFTMTMTMGGDTFLDFSSQANMGFADKTAGDGVGGWSDQGAGNDFSCFDVLLDKFGNVPFRIIDPAKNGGKAIMTFRSPYIKDAIRLDSALIDTKNVPASNLYILHTTCWGAGKESVPVGTIQVKFKNGEVRVFPVMSKREVADWVGPASQPNGALVYTGTNSKGTIGFYLSKFAIAEKPQEVESVSFTTAGKSIWIIAGATLSTTSYDLPAEKRLVIKESEEWKAPDLRDTVIRPGSALDIGQFLSYEPVGTYGRVIVNSSGNLAFEKKADNINFFCCSISSIPATKEKINIFADTIRRQGYNIVRFHFLDDWLMGEAKANFEFNETKLDLFEYFVACLKERGIYLYFDAMTSNNGFRPGHYWSKGSAKYKNDIMALAEVREHWRIGVTKLLTHENPYTKMRLVDDPVIAVLLYYNELEFYTRGGLHPVLASEWHSWLKKSYGNDGAALAKAWNNPAKYVAGTPIDQIPLFDESGQYGKSQYSLDVGRFMSELERNMGEWFETTIRNIGYRGLTTLWDMGNNFRYDVARTPYPVVSIHNYHAHATDWVSKGSSVDQSSAIANAGGIFRSTASTRLSDRPLFVAEYAFYFWCSYRYEEGLLFGAYSALQDFSGVTVHAVPVSLSGTTSAIKPCNKASDPIGRASEVMTAFLYRRKDVTPSKNIVELRFDDKSLFQDGLLNSAPSIDNNLISLVCKFGLWYDNPAAKTFSERPKPVAVINASGGAQVKITANTMDVVDNAKSDEQTTAVIASLKKQGILSPENKSDTARGIYQSDTGEITMETKRNTITVITPRFEGIATDRPGKHSLKAVTSVQSTIPSAIAVISLDNNPLANSSRMLVVYSTDALNNGMELSQNHSTLYSLGKGPVLIRTGQFTVDVKTAITGLEAWALAYNGKRMEKLPVSYVDGTLHFTVNTAKLAHGPSSFFELVKLQ